MIQIHGQSIALEVHDVEIQREQPLAGRPKDGQIEEVLLKEAQMDQRRGDIVVGGADAAAGVAVVDAGNAVAFLGPVVEHLCHGIHIVVEGARRVAGEGVEVAQVHQRRVFGAAHHAAGLGGVAAHIAAEVRQHLTGKADRRLSRFFRAGQLILTLLRRVACQLAGQTVGRAARKAAHCGSTGFNVCKELVTHGILLSFKQDRTGSRAVNR